MRLVFLLALGVASCGGGSLEPPADLGASDSCLPPPADGGACTRSAGCARGTACFAGACSPVAACVSGCAPCSDGRVCDGAICQPPPGALCGPCGEACTMAGGMCRSSACATRCDDMKTYCPRGFRCDKAIGARFGYCIPTLAATCAGCAADGDCPKGEVCNVNNRRCVPAPTGPDARLEMNALDFYYSDNTGMGATRNVQWSMGFFSSPDPSFDPYALAAGSCASERSGYDENAPFPLGPMRDAGDPLTLTLPGKTVPFMRQPVENPAWGFSYLASGLRVADWVPGAASWSGAGGADVGAFRAAGTIPPEFTTTPDIVGPVPASANVQDGVTLTFDAPAPAGVRTYLEVAFTEGTGAAYVLTRIACRAPDGAASATIPGKELVPTPRGVKLTLLATRATVVDFTARGVTQGRAVFGMQKVGEVVVAP